MPAPTNDAYSAASGSPVYGGWYPGGHLSGGATLAEMLVSGSLSAAQSELAGNATLSDIAVSGSVDGVFTPTWRTAMAANTWAVIPTANVLLDLDPKLNPAMNPNFPGNPEWYGNGPAAMISAWCGACFDMDTDTLWIPLGGGHGNYGGNEAYKLSLASNTPTWVMPRPPSGAIGNILVTQDGNEISGIYSDGRARANHTYSRPVFIPGVGPCLSAHCSGWVSAQKSGAPTKFLYVDPVTGDHTFGGTSPTANGAGTDGACATYDPLRHCVWYMPTGAGTMHKYDIATNTWSYAGTSYYTTGSVQNVSITYIPGDDVIAYQHEYFGAGIRIFDPTNNTYYTPTVTGTLVGLPDLSGKVNSVWVPSLNALAMWNNTTDRTIINLLNKPANPRTGTWTISQLPVAGSNVVTPSVKQSDNPTSETNNRFQFSNRLNGFVLLNRATESPYFYALS